MTPAPARQNRRVVVAKLCINRLYDRLILGLHTRHFGSDVGLPPRTIGGGNGCGLQHNQCKMRDAFF